MLQIVNTVNFAALPSEAVESTTASKDREVGERTFNGS